MRIAIVSQSYPPMVSGAALFAGRLANYFSTCGHEVLVLAASDRPDPYSMNLPHLRVERCRSYHNPVRVGQRFSPWPHRQVVQCLAEFAPNVIHLHDPLQLAISCLSFSRPRKIPVILTIHALPSLVNASFKVRKDVWRIVESGLWRYARWVINRCSSTVVATQTVAEVVYAHTGIEPEVISCGVDLRAFSPDPQRFNQEVTWRARLGIPDLVPVILHVGRLDTDKQVEKVVRAAALAMQKTQAHLLVVGDGTQRGRLEQLSTWLGIGDRSHFPGFISAEDGLPALYQMSTVFTTASEIETQGLVLLEAAACALPIVAVQATCLHEIVNQGKNGFLVRSGDITEMAECIISLVGNPTLAHEMGQMSRRIVESHTMDKTFTAYEDLYLTALKKTGFVFSPRAAAPGHAERSGESG